MSEEIRRLTEEGRAAALEGRCVAVEPTPNEILSLTAHPSVIEPDDFLKAVSVGAIEVRGITRKKNETDVQFFLHEFSAEFGDGRERPFMKSVASAWARWSAGRATEDVSARMARACAPRLSALWRLGIDARLSESVLDVALHRTDVRSHIRAVGWLEGEILRLRSFPGGDFSPLHFLEKNRYTILVKALKQNDPHYPRKVSQTLPRMIEALRVLVERMRASSDPTVLEAAVHLAGTPGTGRKGNLSSLINYAICSGRLLDYVREVEHRFAGGDIVREIEATIRKLGGNPEQFRSLRNNKATIISRSIHHGTLDYRPKLEKALEAPETKKTVRLQNLESENRRLRSLVADLMLSRR